MTRGLLLAHCSCGSEQILDITNILDKTTATTETVLGLVFTTYLVWYVMQMEIILGILMSTLG